MKNAYALNTLSNFCKNESSELESLGLKTLANNPSEETLQNILGYSKQLSVRTAPSGLRVEQNLN